MTAISRQRLIGRLLRPSWMQAETTVFLPRPVARWVLGTSASMPLILTGAWLVADELQPSSYSPVRQTVSVMSGHAGAHRWIVTSALYVIGLCYLITATGLSVLDAPSRIGLVVAGLAAWGVASFPEPQQGTSRAHVAFTALGALAITAWPILAARQRSVLDAVGARWCAVAIAVSVALFVWTTLETRDGSALGLAERTSSGLQACWPFVVAAALYRVQRSRTTSI